MVFETTLAQPPEGLTVGTQGSTHCQWCDHEFDEGDTAIVLFTQTKTADTDRWEIHRIYCTACNPSTIARPVLDRAKLLAQCRLGTCADVATHPTKLVVFEPELIDSSRPVESSPVLESNESVSPDTSEQPVTSGSNGVEIETLPPSLSTSATQHLESESSVRSEEQPIPDGGAD